MCVALLSLATASAVAAATTAEPLTELMARYDEAMSAALYTEATEAAAGYIATLLATPDYSPKDWAEGLVKLGDAQRHAGEILSSLENYQLAIEIYRDEGDRLSPNLIDPLNGAAQALIEMRELAPAIEVFERVVHLQRVNFGLNHPSQAPVLQSLSDLYLELGDHDRAVASQRAVTNIYYQNFPGDDLRMLPALFAEADLLARTGHLVDSHLSYRRIIAFIERADGELSPELLEALFRISNLLVRNEIKDGYDGYTLAQRYMNRARYIADNSERVSLLQRADTYIATGDFLTTYTPQREKALRLYQAAWDMLAGADDFDEELQSRFSRPTLLNEVPAGTPPLMRILLANLGNRDTQPATRIYVRFDVDSSGLPRNIDIVEGDPSGYWDPIFERHINEFVFRPSFDNGTPVDFADLSWSMPYLPTKEILPE